MKIKFEVKSNPKQTNSLYTIFLELKDEDKVEFLITQSSVQQVEIFDKNPAMQRQDVPIKDGIVVMNKQSLKKFIIALQALAKS